MNDAALMGLITFGIVLIVLIIVKLFERDLKTINERKKIK